MSTHLGIKPRQEVPALLHSNVCGYWIGSRGREMTVFEHARAQGLPSTCLVRGLLSDKDMFGLIGNAMSVCVCCSALQGTARYWAPCKAPERVALFSRQS